ncbi:MAG TPA: thioredoxin family protein [Methanoregula sp.]|nr:thioredoxin family protein [Methanoregula sp.]
MAVRILCFYQPGCMGCMEQEPINREVEKVLGIKIEGIDAVEKPQYVKDYQLKVTPTIILLQDGIVRERFEGVVYQEQLLETFKKYL